MFATHSVNVVLAKPLVRHFILRLVITHYTIASEIMNQDGQGSLFQRLLRNASVGILLKQRDFAVNLKLWQWKIIIISHLTMQ